MRNIKLTIEYDGSNYAGWQAQNSSQLKTIQETIEKALQKIFQKKIHLIGSGRTDAGVHARAQVANFKIESTISCKSIQKAINAKLPVDITITNAEEAGLDFHARFSAKSKVYRYCILNRPYRSSIERSISFFVQYKLNLSLMKKTSEILLGRHDFMSFQSQDKINRASVRTIKNLQVKRRGDFIFIDIEADGFLYNMVRAIAGTIIDIGRGKLLPGYMKKILSTRNRKLAGPNAPAHGLCLLEVKY